MASIWNILGLEETAPQNVDGPLGWSIIGTIDITVIRATHHKVRLYNQSTHRQEWFDVYCTIHLPALEKTPQKLLRNFSVYLVCSFPSNTVLSTSVLIYIYSMYRGEDHHCQEPSAPPKELTNIS